jgi:hypothetical protein
MRFRLKTIWHILPVPIFELALLPRGIVGVCLGAAVILKTGYLNDSPTIEHELEHCRQFWSGGTVFHFARYQWSQRYRERCELEAFAREIATCTESERKERFDLACRSIASCYKLSITESETARELANILVNQYGIHHHLT